MYGIYFTDVIGFNICLNQCYFLCMTNVGQTEKAKLRQHIVLFLIG